MPRSACSRAQCRGDGRRGHAGRDAAFHRRYRQRGAAAARHAGARRPPDERHPFGHGKTSISGRSWCRSCCSRSAARSRSGGARKLLHGGEHAMSLWAYAILTGASSSRRPRWPSRCAHSVGSRPAARSPNSGARPATPRSSPCSWKIRRRWRPWWSPPRPGAGAGHRSPVWDAIASWSSASFSCRRRRPRAGEPFVVDRRASSGGCRADDPRRAGS